MITKTIHASIHRKRLSSFSFAYAPYQLSSYKKITKPVSIGSDFITIDGSTRLNQHLSFTTTTTIRSYHSSLPSYFTQKQKQKSTELIINGNYCYQKVLDAIDHQKREEEEKEQQQAMEQYEAMERVTHRSQQRRQKQKPNTKLSQRINDTSSPNQNKAAGVAAIRTITKQARKNRNDEEGIEVLNDPMNDIQITKTMHTETINTDFESQLDIDWKIEELKWLNKAALEFLHPKALVRLGNQMLEEKDNTVNEGSLPEHFMGMNQRIEKSKLKKHMEEHSMNFAQKAAYLYKVAGQQGSSEGWFNLGHMLWTGYPEQRVEENQINDEIEIDTHLLPRDLQSSLQAFEKAIELGDADAMYFVGVQLLLLPESQISITMKDTIDEFPDPTDSHLFPPAPSSKLSIPKQRGLTFIQKAANEHHHGGAMHYLALLYLNGDPSLSIAPCAPHDFQTLLDQACDVGHDPDALYLRAHSYYHGNTFFPSIYPLNKAKALHEFEAAANYGNSDGAVSAGVMWYEQGDYDTAFDWYQKAAEMGNKEGWRNLVRCYALGEGVIRSESTAKYIAKLMLNDDDDDDDGKDHQEEGIQR